MDPYRRAILRWTRSRVPFTLIEERINAIEELNEEERSALWLYAWALRSRHEQVAEARAMMAMMDE